jgi:hypothetical protein
MFLNHITGTVTAAPRANLYKSVNDAGDVPAQHGAEIVDGGPMLHSCGARIIHIDLMVAATATFRPTGRFSKHWI